MPTTTTPESFAAAITARRSALTKIEMAQALLYEAAQVSCPLQGFVEEWEAIGNHADKTKALWHSVADAPLPTGHDDF